MRTTIKKTIKRERQLQRPRLCTDNGDHNEKDYKKDNGNYNEQDYDKTMGTIMNKTINRQWKLQCKIP